MRVFSWPMLVGLLATQLPNLEARCWAETSYAESLSGNSEAEANELLPASDEDVGLNRLFTHYYGIFYGPGLKNPSSLQPTPSGHPNPDRPVMLKNYLSLGYNVTERFVIAGTAYMTWIPVRGQQMIVQDPYIRIGMDRLLGDSPLGWYGDVRVHFPVTSNSREMDILAAFQTFHILLYTIPDSRLTVGTYASARTNFFGRQGYGYDLELYLGPTLSYQLSSNVAFTLLYEASASHSYGAKPFAFNNDGTDVEPGISWDVTPNLNLNPYLNLYPGNTSWQSTSVGMMVSWKLM